MMKLNDLVQGTRGELKNTVAKSFLGLTIDSRQDVTGQVFIALKGDVHDGHKFLADVVNKNVGAVVSHEWHPELAQKTTWIQVPDTLLALQNLSSYWRQQWGKNVLAITGSNGKTSVKDFTHTLLSQKMQTLKSEGSFNNHWGLPLTLLNLKPEHDIAIVEMGMNHAGEIQRLCEIGKPDIVAVNNVGRAHIEFFGSVEGIAQAKAEIYGVLDSKKTAVFNLADPHTLKMHEQFAKKAGTVFTFGTPQADVHLQLLSVEPQGLKVQVRIFKTVQEVVVPVWGEHNVMNLSCAVALATAAGVEAESIFAGLQKCKTGWGRNQWVHLKSGAMVLFDGYNANPDSFAALLNNVGRAITDDRPVIGVFGEMREQGLKAQEEHFELGRLTALSRVDACFFIGDSRAHFKAGFESVKNSKKLVILDTYKDSLALDIQNMLTTKSLVLVKGSRGGALERVVAALDPLDFSTKK